MSQLINNQAPEIVGVVRDPWGRKSPTSTFNRAITQGTPRDVRTSSVFVPGAKERLAELASKKYAQALATIKALGAQVAAADAWGKVIIPLQQLEPQWGIVHSVKSGITNAQYMAAANAVVGVRSQGAKVFIKNATLIYNGAMKLAGSLDLNLLNKEAPLYKDMVNYMNSTLPTVPYTKDLPGVKDAQGGMNSGWAALNARYKQLIVNAKIAQEKVEASWPGLLDALGLDMNATGEEAMAVWADKYQSKPKDVEAFRELLASLGIPLNAGFDQTIKPMMQFIKSKKKSTLMKIAIPVAVVAAGVATMALT